MMTTKTAGWVMIGCVATALVAARAQDPTAPAEPPRAKAPASGRADASAADLAALQGTWQCTSWINNGLEGGRNPEDIQSSYEGNRLTLYQDGQDYRHALVTLDAGRTPRAMNTWDLDGPYADETNRGIYEISGDTLKVCIALNRAKDRPTAFASTPGSNQLLITYQRRKPEPKP